MVETLKYPGIFIYYKQGTLGQTRNLGKHKVSCNLCAALNCGCTISSILTPRAIGLDLSWD